MPSGDRDYIGITKTNVGIIKLGLLTNIGLRCAYVGIVIGLHWDYQDYIYLFRIPFGVATLRLSPGSSGFVLGKGKHKMSVRP